MTKVKKLYCAIHQKWYDPSKGLCPSCEKGEPGAPVTGQKPREIHGPFGEAEFYQLPIETPDNIIIDQDTYRLYQEQLKRRAEETYRRIKMFRIINFIVAVLFIVVFLVLLLI